MSSLFIICAGIAIFLTLIAVMLGVFSMAKGQEFREKHSNTIMKVRVVAQATAVLMIILAFWVA